MVVTSIRNNNKAFPNEFISFTSSVAGTYADKAYCHVCKWYWSGALSINSLRDHMKNDHGYTDKT